MRGSLMSRIILIMGLVGSHACGYPPFPPVGSEACARSSDCKDANLPVCDTCGQGCGDDAQLCSGKTPICASNQCGACTQHGDCKASAACISDGSCAAEA